MFGVKKSIIQTTSENNDFEFDRFKAALTKLCKDMLPKKCYVQINQALIMNKRIKKP